MRNYYVLSNARIRREKNTLYIEQKNGEKKPLPIENVDSLYLYGEIDLNTRFLNFLSQKRVPLHVFNYYGFYAGSYYPREYLHSGFLLVKQVTHYNNETQRAHIAREFVRGAAHSLLRNLSYYERRKTTGKTGPDDEPKGEITPDDIAPSGIPTDETTEAAIDNALSNPDLGLTPLNDDETLGPLTADPYHTDLPDVPFIDYDTGEGIDFFSAPTPAPADPAPLPPLPPLTHLRATIENLAQMTGSVSDINTLRGFEGKMRVIYYQAWNHILTDGWTFDRRVKRPPSNEINALISFGNSFLYTVCLSEIYRTQTCPHHLLSP